MRSAPASLAITALLALACASDAGAPRRVVYETGEHALATGDGLHRVRAQRTDALFVLPGARLDLYTKIAIAPIEVSYAEPAPGERIHELGPLEREWFDDMMRRELERAFVERDGLTLVEQAGRDVLLLRAQFVDMALGAVERPATGRVYELSTSEFRLILDLADSVSGQSLVRQVDFRRVAPSSLGGPGMRPRAQPVTPASADVEERSALRQTVGNRARTLRESLVRLRAVGKLPPAPGRADG